MDRNDSPMTVHSCDDHMELTTRTGSRAINGVSIPVEEEFYRCSVCGEEEYTYEQAQAADRRAATIYRERQGFLKPDEIRAMRKRWGITQAELEKALGLGRKTVARWEAGRVLQHRALDNLLRVIDRFPPVLAYLADLQRCSLQPNSEWSTEPASSSGLKLPRSLLGQLQQAADEEDSDVSTYAAALLTQGAERRSVNREIVRLHKKVDDLSESVSQWGSPRLPEVVEPWKRDHEEEYGKAVAI